jgi:hypothetical protein
MRLSPGLTGGGVVSLVIHRLALAVFLSIRVPALVTEDASPPVEVHLVRSTASGASASAPVSEGAVRPVAKTAPVAVRIAPRPDLSAARTMEAVTGNPGASGDKGAGGDVGDGVDTRWRVAPRGRNPVANPALKPDCSISNPDYIWPHRDAFCRRERERAAD